MTARAARRPAVDRIVLTAITRADAPVLFRWINDRALVLHNSAFQPVHEASHLEWVRGLSRRQDLVAFAIRLRKTRTLVGVCQLTGLSRVHRSAELQIRIGDARWRGRGLGSEAVRQLLAHAFDDLNLHRVSLQVFATNTPAIRTYERAGFRHEGTLRDAAFIDGRYVDVHVMAVLRGEGAA